MSHSIFKNKKHINHLPRPPIYEAHGSRTNSNKLCSHTGVTFFRELQQVVHDKHVVMIDYDMEKESSADPSIGDYDLHTATFVNASPDAVPMPGSNDILASMDSLAADITAGRKRVVRIWEETDLMDGESRKLIIHIGLKNA